MTQQTGPGNAPDITPLRDFVVAMTRLIDSAPDEPRILDEGAALLGALIARDDWLPDEFAQPHPQYYQQYLLHADPLERFSVVSFVWGPGQRTPVHNHTVWGLVGVLRGCESSTRFDRDPQGRLVRTADNELLSPGEVDRVSPTIGDIHLVANADPGTSISIHVYGANLGAVGRQVFDPETGAAKPFVSGYSSTRVPNLWDRSAQTRAGLRP